MTWTFNAAASQTNLSHTDEVQLDPDMPAESTPLWFEQDARLDEWLELMADVDPHDPEDESDVSFWSFPRDALLKEYLADIEDRPEEQVLHLLRCFLFEYVSFGSDAQQHEFLNALPDNPAAKSLRRSEYGKRLQSRPEMVHPGVRWVLDLIPSHPQLAIDVIDAYVTAHGHIFPDGRLTGLWDAATLISARYMSQRGREGMEILRRLSPRQLEQLTARLYTKMGYQCELTPPTRDGGRDVIAKFEQPGRRDHRVIDCSHYAGTVPITKARAILGVADNEHATSAVLLTTGSISSAAHREAASNSKLDLVDGERLLDMLGQHLGHDWPRMIDYWIQWPPRS